MGDASGAAAPAAAAPPAAAAAEAGNVGRLLPAATRSYLLIKDEEGLLISHS